MTSLDENGTPLFAERLMQAHVWTSNPRASRISSILILKYAINHKDLFTTEVLMGIEVGLGCPPN
jgi:hypothetical protein